MSLWWGQMPRGKNPRPPSDGETKLFVQAMRDAKPLKAKAANAAPPGARPGALPVKRPRQLTLGSLNAAPAKTPPPLVVKGRSALTGLDGANAERLIKGRLEIEGRIDLHGRTEAAAHRALTGFIQRAHAAGKRCVLVITGKGRARLDNQSVDGRFTMPERKGVLFEMVPRWLAERELAPYIVAFHPAHLKHGGGGALYVYLRRARLDR